MATVRTGRARAIGALLAVLLVSPLTVPFASAQTSAAAPAIPGALPESYPWMRLAETLTPAVVNVRTTGEAARRPGLMLPEPFRRPRAARGPGGADPRAAAADARARVRVRHRPVGRAQLVLGRAVDDSREILRQRVRLQLVELAGHADQRIAQRRRLQHPDEQMTRADARLPEHQRRVDPATLDSSSRRATRGPISTSRRAAADPAHR